MICAKCNDTGWVCEYHPDKEAHKCCGGAGMPCTCNTANPPWYFEPADGDPEIPNGDWPNIDDAGEPIATPRDSGGIEPVAWVLPGGDNAREGGWLDAKAWKDGEFSRPLYAAPAPQKCAVKPVAWRYQRKNGWGETWRYFAKPITDQDFETPEDWTVELLYGAPPPPQHAVHWGDFRWLIEAASGQYLAVQILRHSHTFEWTKDYNRALAFRSEGQADAAMMAIRQMDRAINGFDKGLFAFEVALGNAKAVEHGWMDLVNNPGVGAEPVTRQADDRRAAVGRTGGSIPPTGAIFDDLIAQFEHAVVERARGVSRDSDAMEDQINARRDALLAAINAAGKCIYPNCNTGSDPSAKPRSGFSPSTAGE